MYESCCDDFDDEAPRLDVPAEELIACARLIERSLPGEPVPEEAWPIFTGAAAGAVLWPHMERMMRSVEAAGVLCALGTPLEIARAAPSEN